MNIQTQTNEFKDQISEIIEYFQGEKNATSQVGFNSVLVEISKFYFVKNQIIIRSNANHLVYELNRENERYLFPINYFDSITWNRVTEIPYESAGVAYISVSAGSPNWGHFLVDELPRIIKFVNLNLDKKIIHIYFTSYDQNDIKIDESKMNTIDFLYPELSIQYHFLNENEVYFFNTASYISGITYHPSFKDRIFLQYP
jgi:hypothetical protein